MLSYRACFGRHRVWALRYARYAGLFTACLHCSAGYCVSVSDERVLIQATSLRTCFLVTSGTFLASTLLPVSFLPKHLLYRVHCIAAYVAMPLLIACAALLVFGAVHAAPASSFSTSLSSDETCITRIRPASTDLATLPTSTRTSYQTVTTTLTVSGSAGCVTETETAPGITSTTLVTPSYGAGLGGTGAVRTSTIVTTVTALNGTAGAGSCSNTTTISADATSTVYTGSYNGSVAKRTASPFDSRSSPPRKRFLASALVHLFGEPFGVLGEDRKPFEVDCLEQVTSYLIATSAISATLLTTTVTTSAPVVLVTSTQSLGSVGQASGAQSIVTITSVVTAHPTNNSTSGGVCTVTSGEATATTTQHIK